MIHYDSRCYCDSVCRSDSSDCCPGAKKSCSLSLESINTETTVAKTIDDSVNKNIDSEDEFRTQESSEKEKIESMNFSQIF